MEGPKEDFAPEEIQEAVEGMVAPVREAIIPNSKIEFSKLIAIIAIMMWIFVNIFSMVMIAVTQDTSSLMYIVGSVDAVVAIVYTTYSIKAKAENLIKLNKIYGPEAEHVVNAVVQNSSF